MDRCFLKMLWFIPKTSKVCRRTQSHCWKKLSRHMTTSPSKLKTLPINLGVKHRNTVHRQLHVIHVRDRAVQDLRIVVAYSTWGGEGEGVCMTIFSNFVWSTHLFLKSCLFPLLWFFIINGSWNGSTTPVDNNLEAFELLIAIQHHVLDALSELIMLKARLLGLGLLLLQGKVHSLNASMILKNCIMVDCFGFPSRKQPNENCLFWIGIKHKPFPSHQLRARLLTSVCGPSWFLAWVAVQIGMSLQAMPSLWGAVLVPSYSCFSKLWALYDAAAGHQGTRACLQAWPLLACFWLSCQAWMSWMWPSWVLPVCSWANWAWLDCDLCLSCLVWWSLPLVFSCLFASLPAVSCSFSSSLLHFPFSQLSCQAAASEPEPQAQKLTGKEEQTNPIKLTMKTALLDTSIFFIMQFKVTGIFSSSSDWLNCCWSPSSCKFSRSVWQWSFACDSVRGMVSRRSEAGVESWSANLRSGSAKQGWYIPLKPKQNKHRH